MPHATGTGYQLPVTSLSQPKSPPPYTPRAKNLALVLLAMTQFMIVIEFTLRPQVTLQEDAGLEMRPARCHAEPDDLLPATHLASPPSTPLTTAAKRGPRFRVTNLLLT
jgi:hypothetical protein